MLRPIVVDGRVVSEEEFFCLQDVVFNDKKCVCGKHKLGRTKGSQKWKRAASRLEKRKASLLRAKAKAWDKGYHKAVSDYEEDVPVDSPNPYCKRGESK